MILELELDDEDDDEEEDSSLGQGQSLQRTGTPFLAAIDPPLNQKERMD